jgi:uncharacterized membrane protein
MRSLLRALVLGLIGAGIVHIAVLLLVPAFTERDAWSRLAMTADLYVMTPLKAEKGGPPVVKSVDPLFEAIACRFDLDEGMVRVAASGHVPFWSVAVYDRNGHNVYSFSDRSAEKAVLDAIVLTPAQMVAVRKELPADLTGAVFVETATKQGIAVVRAFVPDESWRPGVKRFLDQAACTLQAR